MKSPNLNDIESEAEKRYAKRLKKKKIKMKVSGGSVKELQKIIGKRGNIKNKHVI
jgi:hypothetical protein